MYFLYIYLTLKGWTLHNSHSVCWWSWRSLITRIFVYIPVISSFVSGRPASFTTPSLRYLWSWKYKYSTSLKSFGQTLYFYRYTACENCVSILGYHWFDDYFNFNLWNIILKITLSSKNISLSKKSYRNLVL